MNSDDATFVLTRRDIKNMRHGWDRYDKKIFEAVNRLSEQMAGILKILSSIEMEMLMNRGASLDNNFEGKEEL